MSASILSFTPRVELEPLDNLMAFIALCRESEVLEANRQFEKNIWKTGYRKGRNHQAGVTFNTLEASGRSESEPSMPQPFLDFAKASLVYLKDVKPVEDQGLRLSALRCLEAALRECKKDSRPTAVDEMVLDAAVELAKQKVSPARAYSIGAQLVLIAEFMHSKGFILLRQRWKHGVPSPRNLGSRISKEALAARQKKLPTAAVLRALGGIFHEAIEPADVLLASYTGLMLCAPERINEVLRLRRDCLVEGDGEYRNKLGLRWSGSKGFENATKWLPTEMAPVAREAVANLIEVTAPARKIAAWYTKNPKKLYLHEGAVHLRDSKILSMSEIALILWGDESAKDVARNWARTTNKLPKQSIGRGRFGYFFEDVERAVLAMLPETFPYVPGAPELLCRQSMAIMRTHEMDLKKSVFLCMFSCVDYGMVTKRLGTYGRASIFERFNYREDDGSPIMLQSHSLRHYLNMLAQTGGLSSAEIAIFSGRKDVKQNRAYDHMSSDEVQAPINLALKTGFTSELEPVFEGRRNLIARSDFENNGLTAAHTTEYGWCAHDFASEPCQMYRDCINCEEQECIKGDAEKEANLRMLKTECEYLLNRAREALNEEEFGADSWVKHQTVTLERVNALLSILEDPAIPFGARVRLDVNNAPLIANDSVQPIRLVPTIRRKAKP
ncbi:integrase [Paraburkholderia sp. CNPSo 3157]|uniref:Integrase n=1 Tax=Paraburkholderia franconis TaxID=2654983 RepID=A0A7X1ND22_9BURK|nr:integrase [Paraburkholderia franconis]MPW19730.1 integrase [Paraburkholderia franconis]